MNNGFLAVTQIVPDIEEGKWIHTQHKRIWIRPDRIEKIEEIDGHTRIDFTLWSISVAETPEEILEKVK